MKTAIAILLVVAGVIHLLPVAGVIGPEKLAALYGIAIDNPNLAILMRHRAVLFGLLGAFLCWAAWRPDLQPIALGAGAVSAGSFLWLAWKTGGYNALLERVVVADIVAMACLALAAVLYACARLPAAATNQ